MSEKLLALIMNVFISILWVCMLVVTVQAGDGKLQTEIIKSGKLSFDKLDYLKHPITVVVPDGKTEEYDGDPQNLVMGETNPWRYLKHSEPTREKPVCLILDYQTPVTVGALAHYFYFPGNRDHRSGEWLSGPSAFGAVRLSVSDDQNEWKEVSCLKDLPSQCPQLLKIPKPVKARYLKLEVLGLVHGASGLYSYEIETYLGKTPDTLPISNKDKAIKNGFPNKKCLEVARGKNIGTLTLSSDKQQLKFMIGGVGLTKPLSGQIDILVDQQNILWKSLSQRQRVGGSGDGDSSTTFNGISNDGRIELEAQFVKSGLLLSFRWKGPIEPPFSRLDVQAGMSKPLTEWYLPMYKYSHTLLDKEIEISSAHIPTRVAIVGDGHQTLSMVPDTDQSWVGLKPGSAYTAFPLTSSEPSRVLLLASQGDWFSGFEHTVSDVYDFDEPRQSVPVSQLIPGLLKHLLQPNLWNKEHQMIRSFPDNNTFMIFYDLPYAVQGLGYWAEMVQDPSIQEKIDCVLRFALSRRYRDGNLKGAIFPYYIDRAVWVEIMGGYPFGAKDWIENYSGKDPIGMDQGGNRWFTSHTMGSVLWSTTHVWRLRGKLPNDILAGASDVADWLVRNQREDGSWPYAFDESGNIAYPTSDSGSIWNIWALYRYGKLTKSEKYLQSAKKAAEYFKATFTKNHLYRGYWEDMCSKYSIGYEPWSLSAGEGIEAAIAVTAFHEMDDREGLELSAHDMISYICTRTLESRTYETSYGHVAEQQGCAPATYLGPTFGRAAQIAWRSNHRDIFQRFSGLAKAIGWWIDDTGASFWVSEGMLQEPIEMLQKSGGERGYWSIWDTGQKIVNTIAWLVDEVNYRSEGRISINPESLKGKDGEGRNIAVRLRETNIHSTSGQVNWLWLESTDATVTKIHQLVLINHGEATEVIVPAPFKNAPSEICTYDSTGKSDRKDALKVRTNLATKISLPKQHMAVLTWK